MPSLANDLCYPPGSSDVERRRRIATVIPALIAWAALAWAAYDETEQRFSLIELE